MAMESHPTEDELERFLLHQSEEEELDRLESHILACDSCVSRLEDLEMQIAATRIAIRDIQREQAEKAAARQRSTWKVWLTGPRLGLASGVAVMAIGLSVAPSLIQHRDPVAEVSLSANRGAEGSVLPANHRLQVHLNARDLAEGSVVAKLVDSRGDELWQGSGAVRKGRVDLSLPSIHEQGSYFVRLYAANNANSESELLREFAVQVK